MKVAHQIECKIGPKIFVVKCFSCVVIKERTMLMNSVSYFSSVNVSNMSWNARQRAKLRSSVLTINFDDSDLNMLAMFYS